MKAKRSWRAKSSFRSGKSFFVELRNPYGMGVSVYKQGQTGGVEREGYDETDKGGILTLEYKDYIKEFEHVYINR